MADDTAAAAADDPALADEAIEAEISTTAGEHTQEDAAAAASQDVGMANGDDAQPTTATATLGEDARQDGGDDDAPFEPRIPAKKDATLREFLGKMDEFAPIIPDAVTNYYLTLAGLPPPPQTPLPLARLLALATQKFVADVAADAYQFSRIRSSNTTSNNPMTGLGGVAAMGAGTAGNVAAGPAGGAAAAGGAKGQEKQANLGVQKPGYGGGGQGGAQGRTVLTMEDLGMAVGEYGVNVKRGEFYR